MEEKFKQSRDIRKTPLTPEELLVRKERYLNDFRNFRFNYIEDFPKERLMPDMPNYHLYKCRTNFFNAISVRIIYLQHLKLINSTETKKDCEEFFKFCDTIRGTERFYTREDIDKANKVLDSLIKELSS